VLKGPEIPALGKFVLAAAFKGRPNALGLQAPAMTNEEVGNLASEANHLVSLDIVNFDGPRSGLVE
jgi:hypothetical protein